MSEQTYRVNPAHIAAVRHPEHSGYVVPENNRTYPASDPIVKAYPWMFETESAAAEREAEPTPESVPVVIERATQAPGERRNIPKRQGK